MSRINIRINICPQREMAEFIQYSTNYSILDVLTRIII